LVIQLLKEGEFLALLLFYVCATIIETSKTTRNNSPLGALDEREGRVES
jgi:hypothetical protein